MAEVFKVKNVLETHIKSVIKTIEYIQDNFVYTRTAKNNKN